MDSGRSTRALPRVSFLIRRSRDQRSVSTSPGLIAAAHVLHRLLAPRHPPCALVLLIRKEHVRCRYGVFKVRASSSRARPTRRPLIADEAQSRCPPWHSPSKLNSVRSALERTDTYERGRRSSRRTGSSDDAEQKLEPSTSPAASGVRAPDSLERR